MSTRHEKAVFRVVQFLKPWAGHHEGDRCPMRDWLADALKAQGVVKFITVEVKRPDLLLDGIR